jgi:uncharacterized membrane protein YgcG
MPFLCSLLAAGIAVPPAFFAGPAKVGDSVTYRVSTAMSATQAPDVSTIVITWKAPAKEYARLGGTTVAALAVTRSADGQLSVAANPADPSAASIVTILNQLNFPGRVAASLGGSDHAQMSMSITPPAPSTTASPAPARAPLPVNVPLDVNLLSGTSDVTLIAEGNSNQRGSSSAGGRGGRSGGMGGGWPGGSTGGSMGGWHSNHSGRSQEQSNDKSPSVDIAIQAIFDQSGALQHATYRERFTTQSSSGAQTVEHTITIDRVDERRQSDI